MKYVFLVSIILCVSQGIYCCDDGCSATPGHQGAILVKQGAFLPQDQALRNIFDACGSRACYFAEGIFRYRFCHGLNLELTGSYLERKGCALICQWLGCSDTSVATNCNRWQQCTDYTARCGQSIRFKMPTCGVGLKYFFEVRKRVAFFLGGAFKALFLDVENNSPYVPCRDKKTLPAGMVNVGLHFNPYRCFVVELAADYLIGKVHNNIPPCCSMNCPLNVSGLIAGITLGFKF